MNLINQANILTILRATPDPMCMTLRPVSVETENYLEDVMPEEDIPPGERVAAEVSQIKPITHDQKDMLASLFDNLSVAHERLSRAVGTMSSMCKVMSPEQLMLIMKSSMWPLIQLNTMPGLFDPPIQQERKELTDDKEERIKQTMILRPDSKELHQQPDFSPTRLLAATLSYYVHNHFTQGMTMAELQRKYIF